MGKSISAVLVRSRCVREDKNQSKQRKEKIFCPEGSDSPGREENSNWGDGVGAGN